MKNKMILTVTLIFLLLTLLPISLSAHGGKTDGRGGHYDNSTGEYHYHHGYPAHTHTGGECPYDFVDKTDHSSGSSNDSYSSSTNTKTESTSTFFYEVIFPFLWSLFGLIIIFATHFIGDGIIGIFVKNDTTRDIITCCLIVLFLIISVLIIF
ncbi:MAG: YHYH domain-containing protein [Clostridia bacterium]|nr:YHYH domain-containing protein [Clostridia bacterium]